MVVYGVDFMVAISFFANRGGDILFVSRGGDFLLQVVVVVITYFCKSWC